MRMRFGVIAALAVPLWAFAQSNQEPRVIVVPYPGEARPDCGEATEACWQKNRRAHIRHER